MQLEHTIGEDPAPTRELAIGAQLGKYRLVRVVGAGGMGVVWAAYDPDLDREVALKVLRADDADKTSRTRLLREARAMARLKHPNVVTVYEVGTDANRDYVVMELVTGSSLDTWLATQPSRGEIVDALLAAGRGLAAAHAAGLLHRDFKPHNVLRGDDGRVMVTDFGLARERLAVLSRIVDLEITPTAALDETIDAYSARSAIDSVLGSQLTRTGLLIGTPAYMAPEQLAGGPADASTDQFAYCVTAWQALTGSRPFRGDNFEELRASALAGPGHVGARLPAAIRAALERGLDPVPDRRWPEINTLLAVLERATRKRTRVGGAVAVVVAATVALGAYGLLVRAPDVCTGADRELAGTWNDAVRVTSRAAFVATGLPYAAYASDHAERALDAYGRDWVAMHTEACRASVRKEQSADVLDLRMTCLARRLTGLTAVTELFAHADRQTVDRSVDAVSGLAPITDCGDLVALRRDVRTPPDPATRSLVEAIRAELTRAETLERTGKPDAALAIAGPALASARATAYEPVVATALFAVGRLQADVKRPLAEGTLTESFVTAQAAGDDATALLAAAALVSHVGVTLGRPKEGELWARLSRAIATRTGNVVEEPQLARVIGELEVTQGHYDDAVRTLRAGLDQARPGSAYGDDRSLAILHNTLGVTLAKHGDLDAAIAEFRIAQRLTEAVFGPDHPDVATSVSNLGAALDDQGKPEEAMTLQRRALAIRERAYGPADPEVGISRVNIGSILAEQGNFRDALLELEHGRAIFEHALGGEHPMVAEALTITAEALIAAHRFADARVTLERALAIRQSVLGADHPDVAKTHALLGEVLIGERKFAEAVVELDRARAIQTKVLAIDHPDTAIVLASFGEAHLGLHAAHQAVAESTRALAIVEHDKPRPTVVASIQFTLARASWDDHQDRARAVALARDARAAYAKLPPLVRERAEIDAWLATHDAP